MAKTDGKKYLCAAMLAHVDSGKTTLSENILYKTGSIRKLGRVDSKDTFLDHYALERARGITIHWEIRKLRFLIHRDMWIFPRKWNGRF